MLPAARPLGPDADGQWVRHWTSAGWNRTADAWVRARLADHGRRITGDPLTYRVRFWSVVRCYPTEEGLVWFKENNPGHRFEATLVTKLADLAPDDVITPLAVDHDRGWLLTSDHGPTPWHADIRDQATRGTVVRALARLQRTAQAGLTPLADMPALAPSAAGDAVRQLTRAWADLAPTHPLHSGLLDHAEAAAAVLDEITTSRPLGLELNDVYAANIFADRSSGVLRPRFFDLGNAIWGHPFVSLHCFLDSVVEWTTQPLPEHDRTELYDAYLAEWGDGSHSELDAVRPLTAVHKLIAWARLIPYADELEIRTRAEIPLKYLAGVCGDPQGEDRAFA